MLKLEHIGIAVEDGHAASLTFDRLLGTVPYKIEAVAREGLNTLFIDVGGSKLELLESTGSDSVIARYLKKRSEGLHHIAVEVDDIETEIVRVRSQGFNVLSEVPFDGADGKRVFFVHPKDCHGILVEFCQQARSTWRDAEIEMPHGTVTAYSAGSSDATPVLLLHDDHSSTGADFDELLPTLERSMHVIAFDSPDRSTQKDARAILKSYRVEQPSLVVGRGLGAVTAEHVAQSDPELVRGVVFVDPERSIIRILEKAHHDIPTLVCSLKNESLEVASEISTRFPNITLSVIPEFGGSHIQLAEQIVAFGTWS